MTRPRSLRSRLIFGSALWAVGLLAFASVIVTTLLHRHPAMLLLVAHNALITVLALACIAAGLSQLRRGLSPFNQLRAHLSSVRDGEGRRVEGSYPAEVQPLVDDLNALLDDRERRVARALTKAGDLAHGLKTPLAVLAQEAERAHEAGHGDFAATVGHQVERMRRQIDYHLAQARAAASGATAGARSSVRASVDGLSRTLLRLHADRGLTINVEVAPDYAVRTQREDLDEMLGNLLDNACRWARSRVTVASSDRHGTVTITVDDDGPGLAASMREVVLQRGVRADEAAQGSGFGLAIVRDLAELYGGSIALDTSPDGGLRARLQLPGC